MSSTVHMSNNSTNENTMVDKFGIKEIYPTNQHGREWYVNMTNPKNDTMLSFTFDAPINKEKDGSWQITNPKVRMNVETPTGNAAVEECGDHRIRQSNISKGVEEQ